MEIYIGNDNLITVDKLQNAATEAYITSGTVTAQLEQEDGTDIGSLITLSYVSVSGKWRGTIQDTVSLTAQDSIRVVIDVDAGSGLIGHWEVPATVLIRTA